MRVAGEEAMVCQAHRQWGERFARLFTPLPPPANDSPSALDPDRPLRVSHASRLPWPRAANATACLMQM